MLSASRERIKKTTDYKSVVFVFPQPNHVIEQGTAIMANWFYSNGTDQNGPVTSADIRALALSGKIKPSDLLWKEGMADWVAASNVENLVFKPSATPPPLPRHQPEPETDFFAINTNAVPEMISDDTRRYWKTLDQVFVAAQRTVRDLGYKVDTMDRANGLLNFKTGMSWKSFAGQEMSVMMIDNGDGSVDVSITGRRNQNGVVLQVYDWGEAKGIASNVFKQMDAYL